MVLWVIRVLLPLAALVGAVGFTARYPLRYWCRHQRTSRIGELKWVEIVHENRTATHSGKSGYDQGDFGGIYSFLDQLKVSRWPYSNRGVASIVWLRTPDGTLHLYAGMSQHHAERGAPFRALASSLGGRAILLDSPPDIPTGGVVLAQRNRLVPVNVKDRVESSGTAADAMSMAVDTLVRGEVAAVVVTMDMMRNSETSRLQANIAEEDILKGGAASTYQSVSPQARIMVNRSVRISVAATNSADNPSISEDMLRAALNGISTLGWSFDPFSPRAKHTRSATYAALGSLVVSTMFTVVGVLPWYLGVLLLLPAAAVVGVIVVKPELLTERWVVPDLRLGEIIVPSFIWASLRWRVHGIIRSNRHDGDGDTLVGNRIAPSSCKQVLTLHAAAAFELLSFPDRMSVDVHQDSVQSRGLPSKLVDVEWPIYLGSSGTGQVVALELADLHFSLYTAGVPGSGKTNFLHVIFAGVVKACIDGMGGLQITPIWGETKGEGAYDAWRIARHHSRAMFIDAHNPRSHYRLALEGRRLSDGASVQEIIDGAANLVSALQFAYGDGIRAASREMLEHSIRISMLLSPSEIKYLELEGHVNKNIPNVVDLAFYILGGDVRLDPGPKLLTMSEDLADEGELDERESALNQSIGVLSRFFNPQTRRQLTERVSAPLSKLSELRAAKLMFTPDDTRVDAYVPELPSVFAPIVINMGPYYTGNWGYDTTISAAVNRRLLLTLNYLLWDKIKSSCSGWNVQGKRIPMFFDEVADVAVDSQSEDVSNVLAEALKEGRSRGASYYLGCQFPSQMPFQARHNVLSSRSKLWFNLQEAEDLQLATLDLASGDTHNLPYSQHSIRGLPDGTCVGIIKRGKGVTPPFTLQVPWAPKWAELLLREGCEVGDAIADYVEWYTRSQEGRELDSGEPIGV